MIQDRKASEEPAATALKGDEFWAGVQGGRDVQVNTDQVTDFVTASLEPTLDELRATNAANAKALRKLKLQIFLDL